MNHDIDNRTVNALFDEAYDEVAKVTKERDALRAENQQLHAVAKVHLETGRTLAAQNERLKRRTCSCPVGVHFEGCKAVAYWTEVEDLKAENEQLKKDNELAANELVEYAKLLAQSSIDENHALRAENERIEAEFRAEIQTEHAAYQELHRKNERLNVQLRHHQDMEVKALRDGDALRAENEDLKRRLAAQDDVVLAARATVAAAHRRGNDIETGLVSGLHDALRRAGLEKLY